jgi:hypothetical protein
MKSFLRSVAAGLGLVATSWAVETVAVDSTTVPPAHEAASWSLVYLPDFDWTAVETEQALKLLQQLKPDLAVSMNPCPFAEAIRGLESKPAVLDQTQRAKSGAACGLPDGPLEFYKDSSTLHPFGHAEGESAGLVWLSSDAGAKSFNGPQGHIEELRSLGRMQIRKQFAERHGEVIFLVDPSVSIPSELTWRLPRKVASYDQAATAVTGFACIRPGSLQTRVAAIDGLVPRVPVVHWIHSGTFGMEWEVLPIDGGPAIQRSTPAGNREAWDKDGSTVGWLKAPPAPLDVPLWMDDYINNNPAIGTGENIPQGRLRRRFGWEDYGVTRDQFQLLRVGENPIPAVKPSDANFWHGAVRSPGNLFSISVGQLGEKGYPVDGDDGVNVYLNDFRRDQSSLLYFACLSCAWPDTATWFTDRYVMTAGVASSSMNEVEEGELMTPAFRPQTIHLFDLQTGRSFFTSCIGQPGGVDRPNGPTDRIYFPQDPRSREGWSWRMLWKAVEDGYQAKSQPAPFPAEEVAGLAKLPNGSDLQWKDLGIWPPPENWRLGPENEQEFGNYRAPKPTPGGDPFLTCTEIGDGQRSYSIAIAGDEDPQAFNESSALMRFTARADLFITGGGSLPQLETIKRLGDNDRYLLLAGSYHKAGTDGSGKSSWMLLTDLLSHRSWSAHW